MGIGTRPRPLLRSSPERSGSPVSSRFDRPIELISDEQASRVSDDASWAPVLRISRFDGRVSSFFSRGEWILMSMQCVIVLLLIIACIGIGSTTWIVASAHPLTTDRVTYATQIGLFGRCAVQDTVELGAVNSPSEGVPVGVSVKDFGCASLDMDGWGSSGLCPWHTVRDDFITVRALALCVLVFIVLAAALVLITLLVPTSPVVHRYLLQATALSAIVSAVLGIAAASLFSSKIINSSAAYLCPSDSGALSSGLYRLCDRVTALCMKGFEGPVLSTLTATVAGAKCTAGYAFYCFFIASVFMTLVAVGVYVLAVNRNLHSRLFAREIDDIEEDGAGVSDGDASAIAPNSGVTSVENTPRGMAPGWSTLPGPVEPAGVIPPFSTPQRYELVGSRPHSPTSTVSPLWESQTNPATLPSPRSAMAAVAPNPGRRVSQKRAMNKRVTGALRHLLRKSSTASSTADTPQPSPAPTPRSLSQIPASSTTPAPAASADRTRSVRTPSESSFESDH